ADVGVERHGLEVRFVDDLARSALTGAGFVALIERMARIVREHELGVEPERLGGWNLERHTVAAGCPAAVRGSSFAGDVAEDVLEIALFVQAHAELLDVLVAEGTLRARRGE